VVDGSRGLGNGRCLPAGPLREPRERLAEVDLVLINGAPLGLRPDESTMAVVPGVFVNLVSGERMTPEHFADRHPHVRAVAGIGNPDRFAATLEQLGIDVLLHGYPDHHPFDGSELNFEDDLPIVCTEKDAVKLRRCAELPPRCWYLEVDVVLEPDVVQKIADVLCRHGIAPPSHADPSGARDG
jgi:tetraacyldisaccharide 4'-kinase